MNIRQDRTTGAIRRTKRLYAPAGASGRAVRDCPACRIDAQELPRKWCFHQHPVTVLTLPDGRRGHVDRGLAPLLRALWAKGYDTFASCQGGPPTWDGRGYIAFALHYPPDDVLPHLPWPARFLDIEERPRDLTIRFPGMVEV